MRSLRFAAFLCGLLCSSVFSVAGPQATSGNSDLDLGAQAYENARYEEAIQHFERAVAIEPTNVRAHLYLATALANQYIPGADNPGNNKVAEQAIDEFKKVLDMKLPRKQEATSLKGIASLYFNMKKLDQAKEYHHKVTELDPNDPESYYSIAVIDWTQTYQPRMELRAKLDLKQLQPLIRSAECWQLRDANRELVDDGIEMLKKAIELRRDYDDAMAYMNLMYRERADIQCGDAKAYAADLKTADDWVGLTIATKKRKPENSPCTLSNGGADSAGGHRRTVICSESLEIPLPQK
jgi:tetratricopeptide (TPR) repeat protein